MTDMTMPSHHSTPASNSTPWSVTVPHRFIVRLGEKIIQGAVAWATLKPGSRPHRVIRQTVTTTANFLLTHPKASVRAERVLARFPALNSRLRAILRNERPRGSQNAFTLESAIQSQNVRVIHSRLLQARNSGSKS